MAGSSTQKKAESITQEIYSYPVEKIQNGNTVELIRNIPSELLTRFENNIHLFDALSSDYQNLCLRLERVTINDEKELKKIHAQAKILFSIIN